VVRVSAWCGCGRYETALMPCAVCERLTCDVCRAVSRVVLCAACADRRGLDGTAPVQWPALALVGVIVLVGVVLELCL